MPTQARAQVTVDAILRATAHILRTKGYDACSTNAVARRAGVSIGSLYQYFRSKDSLITALAREHANRGLVLLHQSVQAATAAPAPIEDQVRGYIRAMVALHHVDPKLHQVLTEQVPRISASMEVVREVSARSAELVRLWLEAHRAHFREVDLDVATFVLVTTVESLTHVGVLDRPEGLDEEALVDEVSELVLRYLLPAAGRQLMMPTT